MNRLNLDFSLQTAEERQEFVKQYLSEIPFKPTNKELEQISDYLLWGKENDQPAAKTANVNLSSRNGTWDKKEQTTSLEQLVEVPSFNQNILSPFYATITQKPKKEKFSRSEARKLAPPTILATLEELWHRIDLLELTLNYYDLTNGKRQKEPRSALINRLTPEEVTQAQTRSKTLTPKQYLNLRHNLVDLRRQQYGLRDLYTKPVQSMEIPSPKLYTDETLTFEADISVLPLGLAIYNPEIFTLTPNPSDFSEAQLTQIFKFYWKKQNSNDYYVFDFRNLEHVYQLILYYQWFKLKDDDSNSNHLVDTLDFYIENAGLSEIQQLILREKINHTKNQLIADKINAQFNKSYSPNYISTVFRHRIIKQINETAQYHLELVGRLAFPEDFKRCSTCNQLLLLHRHNFIKKARSSDGFSARCKVCDKRIREEKKRKNNNVGGS